MTKRSFMSALSSPILAGTAVGVVLVAIFGIQHLRHGWPFSLHHIAPAVAGSMATAATMAPPAAAQVRAQVELSAEQMARSGIALQAAKLESIAQGLRATATVVPDEGRVAHLHTRISGWVEEIYVATTGQSVRSGQPLAGLFSQDLYASQVEFLNARQAADHGPRSSVQESARARLGVLGMSEAEIREIEHTGKARRLITLAAPRSGVLLRRPIAVGTAVDPSTEIGTIADLSRVWVIAEVPEADSAGIRPGVAVRLEFPAAGRAAIDARVEFAAPTLSERTRTVKTRFSVDNADGALRPGVYGTAVFAAMPRDAVTVSRDAVVDTGERQHVFVATAPGRLEPREVTLGTRLPDRVEIRSGLAAGEQVVSAGVFLIDSESRLRASGSAAPHAHGAADKPKKEESHSGH